jgi:hypothetical protein
VPKHPVDKILEEMDGWDVGYVTKYDMERLPPNALTRARNMTLINGSAKKRYGTTKFNATEIDTNLVIDSAYWTEGLLGDALVVTSGGKIINLTSGAQVNLATGLTSGQKYGFAEARKNGTNYLYIFGEGQAPRRWDGAASFSTVSGPAVNCSFPVWHKWRMWAARSTDPSVYMSDPLDPETWQARNSLNVLEPGDGLWTGLVSRRRDLAVFSEGSIYVINGQNPEPPGVDLDVERTTGRKAGSISRDGIAVDDVTGAIYFVSFDGYLYALEGMSKKPLPTQIQDQFDSLNSAALDKVAMTVFGDLLLVSVPYGAAQTTNNRIFVSHLRKPGLPWVEWTGLNIGIFCRRTLTKKLYMADSGAANGFLYLYDSSVFTDAGPGATAVDVDYDLVTVPVHRGEFYGRKRPLHFHLQADVVASGSCTVSSGPNEADIDTEFVDSPDGSISLAASGPAKGSMVDAADVDRNGLVSYPGKLGSDEATNEVRGEWFRVRVRANNAYDMNLRRLAVLEAADPAPLKE